LSRRRWPVFSIRPRRQGRGPDRQTSVLAMRCGAMRCDDHRDQLSCHWRVRARPRANAASSRVVSVEAIIRYSQVLRGIAAESLERRPANIDATTTGCYCCCCCYRYYCRRIHDVHRSVEVVANREVTDGRTAISATELVSNVSVRSDATHDDETGQLSRPIAKRV
jgi:hypothetical protein